MKKNCIVIGGSGLIGREVVKSLIRKNFRVLNLDLKKNKNSSLDKDLDVSTSGKFAWFVVLR